MTDRSIPNNSKVYSDWEHLVDFLRSEGRWRDEDGGLYNKDVDVSVYQRFVTEYKDTVWEALIYVPPGNTDVVLLSVRQLIPSDTRPVSEQWMSPLNAPAEVQFFLGITPFKLHKNLPVLEEGDVTLDDLKACPNVEVEGYRMRFSVKVGYQVPAVLVYATVEGMDGDGPSEYLKYPISHDELYAAIDQVSEDADWLWEAANEEQEE